ncbi:hypothetical protein DFQ28_005122 [Apophysomyces sp. BC1034]|nr:hypothetical protein DFQ30_010532 [Apophysomyces sp. BC1015]KAG0180514.1 hypothetical protein DFQ29_000556 [Apophysomyces sp. BC1021]KAG0188304.1 hypothetical protein DFQ28_005122 [Apophysomyces sp. BC1034]
MSRIARPAHSGGIAVASMPTSPRTKVLSKKSRFSASSTSDELDVTGPTADAPKAQRRSLKSVNSQARSPNFNKAAHTLATRSSTSSNEELSESESLSRFSASSKTSTPRSSLTRSPTQKSNTTAPSQLIVGERVTVPSLSIIGTLRFVGATKFKPGLWTGIELDVLGAGKNDGCVQGIRYFSCPPQTGLFILASKVLPVKDDNGVDDPPLTKDRTLNTIKPVATKSARVTQMSHGPNPTRNPSSLVLKQSTSKLTNAPRSPEKISTLRSMRKTATRSMPERRAETQETPITKTATEETQLEDSIEVPVVLSQINLSVQQLISIEQQPADKTNEIDLQDVCDLLEKTQREKDLLSKQMDGKEAAWERLVSTKESYALLVEEKEEALTRLQRQLDEVKQQCKTLEETVASKEETLVKNAKSDMQEEQYQRRIEKLETFVDDLQTKASQSAEAHENELREHAGQIERMRREIADGEDLAGTLEKECEELRKAGLEAISAYEASVVQLKQQKDELEEEKSNEIEQLSRVITELRRNNESILFNDGDDKDDITAEWYDQRRRLEEQLELATTELDHERLQLRSMTTEQDSLRKEIARLQKTTTSSDERFASLQEDLEKEVQDKRRLIEEADAAFEAQARAEDENYQMKMARVKMEKELADALQKISTLEAQVRGAGPASPSTSKNMPQTDNEVDVLRTQLEMTENEKKSLQRDIERLQDSNKQMEQECLRLMDEMLAMEKAGTFATGSDDEGLHSEIEKLKKEIGQHQQKYAELELAKRTEVNHLSKDLAELEALVESKVFGQGDLEEALENEKKRVKALEEQLADTKHSPRPSSVVSPMSPTVFSSALGTSTMRSRKQDDGEDYCEICETYGHDVISCTALVTEADLEQDQDDLHMVKTEKG